jgi:hypothetical protein
MLSQDWRLCTDSPRLACEKMNRAHVCTWTCIGSPALFPFGSSLNLSSDFRSLARSAVLHANTSTTLISKWCSSLCNCYVRSFSSHRPSHNGQTSQCYQDPTIIQTANFWSRILLRTKSTQTESSSMLLGRLRSLKLISSSSSTTTLLSLCSFYVSDSSENLLNIIC